MMLSHDGALHFAVHHFVQLLGVVCDERNVAGWFETKLLLQLA